MRAPSSSQRLEKPPGAENGLLERTRSALPMQQGRERVAGLHSSPIQHPLGSAAELVTDDNLFLALVPSKLWQEQGRKLGDGWGCNPSVWTSSRQWLRDRLQPLEVCWHRVSWGAPALPSRRSEQQHGSSAGKYLLPKCHEISSSKVHCYMQRASLHLAHDLTCLGSVQMAG